MTLFAPNLFNPIDPRRQVVARVQKPTKPVQRYTAAESKALEDHYIACMDLIGEKRPKKRLPRKAQDTAPDGLTDRVLELIYERPMTGPEVAEKLDRSRNTVYGALRRLRHRGYAKSTGRGAKAKFRGLQKKTKTRIRREEIAARYDLVVGLVTEPMFFEEIRNKSGFCAASLHNDVVALVDCGRLTRFKAAEVDVEGRGQYLYAPAEGGEV